MQPCQNIEFAIIGGVILIGVIVDELARRIVTARREAARHGGSARRRECRGYHRLLRETTVNGRTAR